MVLLLGCDHLRIETQTSPEGFPKMNSSSSSIQVKDEDDGGVQITCFSEVNAEKKPVQKVIALAYTRPKSKGLSLSMRLAGYNTCLAAD